MEAGRTDTMKPDKQRIAIAEYCGWTNCHIGSPGAGGAVDRPGRPVGTPPNRKYTCELPNYTGCLNAMHEAEKHLKDEQYYDWSKDKHNDMSYHRWLGRIVDRDTPLPNPCHYASATVAQRAEAFLKTIGKWENAAEKEGQS